MTLLDLRSDLLHPVPGNLPQVNQGADLRFGPVISCSVFFQYFFLDLAGSEAYNSADLRFSLQSDSGSSPSAGALDLGGQARGGSAQGGPTMGFPKTGGHFDTEDLNDDLKLRPSGTKRRRALDVTNSRTFIPVVSFLCLLTFFLVGLGYFGSGVRSSVVEKEKTIGLNSFAPSVHVVRAERYSGHIKVALRNDSSRSVTSFVMASSLPDGGLFTVKEEFVYSENAMVIGPGKDYEKEFSIPSSLNQMTHLSVSLLTVVFDDKTYEGDRDIAQKIADERSGEKIQLVRVVSLMRSKLELSDRDLKAYLTEDAETEFEKNLDLSSPSFKADVKRVRPQLARKAISDDSIPDELERGARTAMESILRKLQVLKYSHGNESLRDQLSNLKKQYEMTISKL